MSWSRISSRIALLKNRQFLSHKSRFLSDALCPSYKFFKASSGCGNNAWGLMPRCEFKTRPLTESFDFSPYSSRCLGRLSPFSIQQQRHYASNAFHAATEQKSKKTLLYLTALVFAMVGSSYAAVPLYRRFCQATGYGGTVQRRESVEEKIARHEKDGTVATREIVVQFNADVADGMPWKFVPTQREVRVKPGESALAFYTAENRSSTPITGVSTYNVTPMKAAVYFNKIQCFCFEEQRLLPGEQIDMPVFFYIDPEFETDPRMDGINNLILSYTFFKVSAE
ncbi:cytochrome c oxidase assembly protein COX11, mitochondrial-like isoform X2 [Durio zibethinus]|uniref:Cytochrome c oxidase assembly protein COX11, mitochondrial-like isoform X2 n=1 Tax=Durio zibethinus TaxID=66656 RepID=A0A6P5XRP3_DURZI|nr:cytochrome c oxidase assembly protein COX11, mitochondrial-like isoform X2 [Durio zibethinus]